MALYTCQVGSRNLVVSAEHMDLAAQIAASMMFPRDKGQVSIERTDGDRDTALFQAYVMNNGRKEVFSTPLRLA